jgi:hypothetical protein
MDHLVCTLSSSTSCPLILITSPLSKPDGAFSAKLPPKMLPGCGGVWLQNSRSQKCNSPTLCHQEKNENIYRQKDSCMSLHPMDLLRGNCWLHHSRVDVSDVQQLGPLARLPDNKTTKL